MADQLKELDMWWIVPGREPQSDATSTETPVVSALNKYRCKCYRITAKIRNSRERHICAQCNADGYDEDPTLPCDQLNARHKKALGLELYFFRRLLFDCAYDTYGTAAKYVYESERIINALPEADEEIKAREKTFYLLNRLPQSWPEWRDLQATIIQPDKPDNLIAAINARKSTLNLDRLADDNGETVHAVQGRNNSYQGGRRKFDGRSSKGDSGGNAQGAGMSVTCYYSQKKGHRKSQCRKFKYDQRRGVVADKASTAAQAAVGNAPNTSLFTAFSTPRFPSDEGHWLLDSGCSNYVTGSR